MRRQSRGYEIGMGAAAVIAALALIAWGTRDPRSGWAMVGVGALILIAVALRHTVFKS